MTNSAFSIQNLLFFRPMQKFKLMPRHVAICYTKPFHDCIIPTKIMRIDICVNSFLAFVFQNIRFVISVYLFFNYFAG